MKRVTEEPQGWGLSPATHRDLDAAAVIQVANQMPADDEEVQKWIRRVARKLLAKGNSHDAAAKENTASILIHCAAACLRRVEEITKPE